MIDYSVYVPVLSSFVEILINRGVDREHIRRIIGLDSLDNLSTEPVSSAALQNLITLLRENVDDEAFFLRFRLNNASAPRHFSTWMSDNCPTVGDLLLNLCQYSQLTNIADRVRCENSANETHFSYHNLYFDLEHRLYYEYILSFLLMRIDRLTNGQARPTAIEFCYAEPDYGEDYRNAFNCPVYFGRHRNAIIFDSDATKQKIDGHDPHLFSTLKQQADQQLLEIDPKVLIFNVKALIIDSLSHSECNAEAIASRLHMDKATLNRKLKKFGLNFQSILDNTRYEYSRHYESLNFGADEISQRLGFSETSSYKRALKRWRFKN
jgi:AraC-like DNA-binding protein